MLMQKWKFVGSSIVMQLANQTDSVFGANAIIGFVPYGVYGIAKTQYTVYDGSIYRAIVDEIPIGILPSDTDYWELFTSGTGTGSGAGLENVVIYTDSSIEIETSTHYIVNDDAVLNIDLPTPTETTLINIYNGKASNDLSITSSNWNVATKGLVNNSLKLSADEYFQLLYVPELTSWTVVMKERNAIQGDITHLFGFYIVDGDLWLDILTTENNEEIDLSKYDVYWDDELTTWISTNGPVDILNEQSSSQKIKWE